MTLPCSFTSCAVENQLGELFSCNGRQNSVTVKKVFFKYTVYHVNSPFTK